MWCTCAEHEGARARLHTNTQAKNRKKERKGEEVGRERGAQLVSILLFSLCTPVERAASATESRLRLYTRRAAAPERRPALLTARPPPPKISLARYNMAVSLPSRRGRLFVCRPPSYHGKNFATTAATGFRCERTYAERKRERESANVARSQWCVKKGQRPTLTSTRTVQCAARRAAAAAPSFSSCTTYTVCALSLTHSTYVYVYIRARRFVLVPRALPRRRRAAAPLSALPLLQPILHPLFFQLQARVFCYYSEGTQPEQQQQHL